MTRVVVTGIGVLACNGTGRDQFWDSLKNGRSGIRRITRFDTERFPCRIGGQLWDFDPNDFLRKADVKRWHRSVHQSVASAKMAIEDAELLHAGYEPERIAVSIGTSVGNPDETYQHYLNVYKEQGWQKIDKLASTANSGHAPTANVSALFGLRGPAITIASGCATGLDVLTWGAQQLRAGLVDAAVVGATESPIEELAFAGTCSLGILSKHNDEPEKAVRPFDNQSDGLVLSEAAVVLTLELEDKARARGAQIFGEVAGSGSASEGRNAITIDRSGDALARAINAAVQDAAMDAENIDCAHCHGVALKMYDRGETNAYRTALGDHAYRMPISATKSMIGQAYSVGGLLNVVGALMSLREGIMPPTINLSDPDPECDLDFVPNEARLNDPSTALITAMSFGGTHSATVLRRMN